MEKSKKLIIVGLGETASLAFFYFLRDSSFEVVAFSAERNQIKTDTFFDLPVVALEDLKDDYPPEDYEMFVAISSTNLNTLRTRLYRQCKSLGYKMASYISSKTYIGENVEFGDNCFVLENNTIQSFSKIGNNVVIWSGNHIGHSCNIHDNCFISSHVVVSGFVNIGSYCFVGVNSCIADKVTIGEKSLIGIGSIIGKDVDADSIMKMPYAKKQLIRATQFYHIEDFDF